MIAKNSQIILEQHEQYVQFAKEQQVEPSTDIDYFCKFIWCNFKRTIFCF